MQNLQPRNRTSSHRAMAYQMKDLAHSQRMSHSIRTPETFIIPALPVRWPPVQEVLSIPFSGSSRYFSYWFTFFLTYWGRRPSYFIPTLHFTPKCAIIYIIYSMSIIFVREEVHMNDLDMSRLRCRFNQRRSFP